MTISNRPAPYRKFDQHVPALDGLRGVALLLVFYFHTCSANTLPHIWQVLPRCGWLGVDLFFVLSGYLITNILLASRHSTYYYRSFYARRVLRIAPVYYLGLIIILLLQPIVRHHMHPLDPVIQYTWQQEIWYWFNLSNLRSAFFPVEIPLASLYWSLAIEEQFYAIWPTVVRRIKDRSVGIVCIAGIIVTIILRCLPAVQNYNTVYTNFIYRLTPFRLDSLFMGALLAVFLRSGPSASTVRRATFGLFSAGSLLCFVSFSSLVSPSVQLQSKLAYTALALLFASFVAVCAAPVDTFGRLVARIFSLSLLRRVGKYSYFLYVFHLLILYSIGHLLERLTRTLGLVPATYISSLIGFGVCYAVAVVSWNFMEQPILRFKRLFPYRPPHSAPAR